MSILKIAVDGHVLLQKEKTGVGWTAQHIIDELADMPNVNVQINIVDFLGYRCRDIIKHYKYKGCKIKLFPWLPYSVYYKLFNRFDIPYYFLFGRKNDFTLFFEYYVPYQVGTKVASYVYDVNYKVYPETMEEWSVAWLEKHLQTYCDRTDLVITISEFSKEEIKRYLDVQDNRIKVVPSGVDIRWYGQDFSDEQIAIKKNKYGIDGDYILFLGTLEPRKNIKLLIEAFHMMSEKGDTIPKLVIAGKKGWMYDYLFQTVREHQLEEQIIFPGYIDAEDCPVLISAALVFVFPSVYEGFGIPPLEAMACGTPVIVSDAASLPEVVGEAAVLFRSGDAVDLSNKLYQVINDRELQKKLSICGRHRAKEYTWKKACEKLVKVLK